MWSIPVSWGGGGYARTGQAHIGVALWSYHFSNAREYAGVELTTVLISGKKYNVEFYISLLDSLWYGVKNIGAYLSAGQPPSNTSVLLTYEPQVRYMGEEYLSNKEGWTKIEGSFIAQGGEKFITIGNFANDTETDTLFVGGGVPDPYDWRSAGYFIDDVSVTVDTTTSLNELENVAFEVYPNPAKECIVIKTEFREQTMVKLFDVTGREVLTTSLAANKTTLDVSGFAAGVYTAVLLQGDVAVGRKKIIVE